jgi:hypothetical protein
MEATDSKSQILNSWKEVAHYLGRGIRTVQRWEHELGLPVRRPHGKTRSPIIALREDLDDWLNNRPQATNYNGNGVEARSPYAEARTTPLRESIRMSRGLRNRSRELQREMSLALHALTSNLHEIQATCSNGRR